ncbi:MAG: GTP 3',8-cyclase MoaA [Deltaproteobacteria bacterium]|nr:GTP 3',8-cyclase MoaA [Deltaproteobacteria bacterium]
MGRSVRYLRLGVTDRCDMACVYCMPEGYRGTPRREQLSVDEVVRIVRVFYAVGVRTVRLTGGEPLVRRDVVHLVSAIATAVPGLDLALTTNGALLARLARPLRDAGLQRLNISVDSVHADCFHQLTRTGDWAAVRAGIDAARDAGFTEIKTNTVVLRDHNLDQVPEIARWAHDRGLTPRFIELMPLGEGASLMNQHVPWTEIRARLGALLQDGPTESPRQRGPAFYLPVRAGQGRVGFITAVSNHFCNTCDRVRVSARGELRACLANPHGVSLRDAVRQGATDAQLLHLLRGVLAGKDRHAFTTGPRAAAAVVMTGIGG